jgi:dihydroorotate dehydrogenase
MDQVLIYYRNKILHGIYIYFCKPIFFRNDPEVIHDFMTKIGVQLGRSSFGQKFTQFLFDYKNPSLEQNILGINFVNPIGLSAGFDKNAQLTDILPSVGFGFAEMGSITGYPCLGNSKPRLWRLLKSKSLLVYYGLKNDGSEIISKRLQGKNFKIPIGISVAMTNCEENLNLKKAVQDFTKAFKTMESSGSYITINISCPNTSGGQPFLVPHNLDYLLDILDEVPTKKPIFIKLSPDLQKSELDQLLDIVKSHRVDGIICANLTKKRDNPKLIDENIPIVGGMSGKVVKDLADDMLSYIYKRDGKRFILVGCGGVFTAQDAYKKIRLGASLVQMITGMIFEGPQVISEINKGLVELLKRDGLKTINDAIGADQC